MGQLASSMMATGQDTTGLGRWTWICLRGRNNSKVRILTGYRPVADTSDSVYTVHAQHERWLLDNDDDTPPRAAFLRDLSSTISPWLELGDNLIVMLDANANVRTSEIHRFMHDHHLVDCHKTRHPCREPVATCDKNHHNVPIDGIWATAGLDVMKAGYTAFQQGQTWSDHRLLWVDFASQSLFGHDRTVSAPRIPRRLTMSDPRVVRRYNKYLRTQRERHKIPHKLFRLQQKADSELPFDEDDKHQYDQIAELDFNLRQAAERRCRKLRKGAQPFSPELSTAQATIHLWKLMKTLRNGGKVSHTKIRRMAKQLNVPDVYESSIEHIEKTLRTAYRAYKEIKRKAAEHREVFLQQLIKEQARDRKIAQETQQRTVAHIRRQKLVAMKVREATGPSLKTGAFSILDAPDEQRGRHLCTTRAEIEKACAREGRRRYNQANSTPFACNPALTTEMDSCGVGPLADSILAGKSDLHGQVDEFTQKFVNQNPLIPDLNLWLTTEEHRQGWNRMKATTQSSPMSAGFLDYIAGTRDATLATIPISAGFSPKTWSQATDVMIPKKSDSFQVEKLRIIVLFHALFNMFNKRMGRAMLHQAERFNEIPCEAYGS